MKKLTYKDFKIGQKVTCVSLDHENNRDMWEQHLTIGKQYVIEDSDFHFPNSIVVPSDNGKISMFFPIPLFSDIKLVRKMKIEKINKQEMKKEDLLKQENGEALVLINTLNRLEKRSSKLNNEIYVVRTKLKEVCIHNDTEIINSYIEGGYLDREIYVKTLVCKTCGKELDREEKTGNFC